MDRKTQDYYNTNAEAYFVLTKDSFVFQSMEAFLGRVKAQGRILDLGCGSGRDARFFLEQGYQVTALDGSERLCQLASSYIGQPVLCMDYFSYCPQERFDGIWAQASLVHLGKEELRELLKRLSSWLEEEGTIGLSFRYGDYAGEKDGRYYTYLTEESFASLLDGSGLRVVSSWKSEDVRPGFSNQWLNLILAHS